MYGSSQITLTDKGRDLENRMSNNRSLKKSQLNMFFKSLDNLNVTSIISRYIKC